MFISPHDQRPRRSYSPIGPRSLIQGAEHYNPDVEQLNKAGGSGLLNPDSGNYLPTSGGTMVGSLSLNDGVNLVLGTSTGTMIGTGTSQKLGFFGAAPVDRPIAVSDPSGGATQDAEARTAIIAVIDRLQELGLIA